MKLYLMATVASAVLIATPALAQDAAPDAPSKVEAGQNAAPPAEPAAEAPKGPFTLEINLAGVSDYRFRGISLSNKKIAFQPAITLTHDSGFHVGTWASNIADNGGGNVEIDLIGGWGKKIGPIDFDVNATYYTYPGVRDINYVEFISTASHAFGNLTLGTTFAYTPRQGDAAPKRGIYGAVNGSFAIPKTAFSINGSFGIEDNAFYHNKRDYSIGAAADFSGFTVGANYVKASHTDGDPLGRGRVVLSISKAFENSF